MRSIIGVDTSDDRTHTAVAVARQLETGIVVFDVIYAPGVDHADAVARAVNEQAAEHVVVRPAQPIGRQLEQLGIQRVLRPTPVELKEAFWIWRDEWNSKRLRIPNLAALRSAIQHADLKPAGDGEVLARRGAEADMSPLQACILSLWGVLTAPEPVVPFVMWAD
jgi:hypothetical protein